MRKMAVVLMVAVAALAGAATAQATTPAEDHANCVATFDEQFCHDLECDEWFGLDGCPSSGITTLDEAGESHSRRSQCAGVIDGRVSRVEARCALVRLFHLHDARSIGLPVKVRQCHHAARGEFAASARVACAVRLRLPGTLCRARASVVETRDDRISTIHTLRCERRG